MSDSLAVVGFGSMGSALVAGALRSNLFSPTSILVLDSDPLARKRAGALGCVASDDPSIISDASMIAIAVKPQSFPELALRRACICGHCQTDLRRNIGHAADAGQFITECFLKTSD